MGAGKFTPDLSLSVTEAWIFRLRSDPQPLLTLWRHRMLASSC